MKFKYDIAISLCKQDAEFAGKLVNAINPSLKVFFYKDNQEELISKSGPEKFGKVFKDEARVVVILSRNEWSESFYTEIERNAIIDRTSVKNHGYNFLFVVPMEPGQIPSWYPTTQIYADPRRFSPEELARFIEFKVTELGGTVKPITLEERYEHLLSRMEEKKKLVRLQETKEAIEAAKSECEKLKEIFNQKMSFLQNKHFDRFSWYAFSEHLDNAQCGIGSYLLECKIIRTDELYNRLFSSQDFCISFQLYQVFGNNEEKKILESEAFMLYYSPPQIGWAVPYLHEQATNKETQVLFRNRNNQFYDLKNPVSSENAVDKWYQNLLEKASVKIERYL